MGRVAALTWSLACWHGIWAVIFQAARRSSCKTCREPDRWLQRIIFTTSPRVTGTQFGIIARNMPLLGLLGHNPNVRFDPHKFTWIGSASDFSDDAYVLIVRKDSPVKSIDDARRPDGPVLVLGGTAEGASSADVPKILRDALGLHMKLILGYRNSAAIFLAMESAELSGRMVELSSVRATHPQWLRPDSDYRILVMYARTKRDPEFPDARPHASLRPTRRRAT